MEREWARIDGALHRRYQVAARGADWIGLRIGAGEVVTPVVVKLGSRAGRPCLVLAAGVAVASAVPALLALQYNATAEHGGLALEDGNVSLRLLAPVDDPEDVLAATLEGMAQEAARVRMRLALVPSSQAPFVGYVE